MYRLDWIAFAILEWRKVTWYYNACFWKVCCDQRVELGWPEPNNNVPDDSGRSMAHIYQGTQ